MYICVKPPPLPQQPELALWNWGRWTDRKEAHVRFIGGDPIVWDRIAHAVNTEWNRACGFQFKFEQAPDAEIRVGFVDGGTWSHIGSSILPPFPAEQTTMNFGWLDKETPWAEILRVVTHEFGHALGFIHEHQSPMATIPWDVEKVYAHYERTNGWSRDMVDAQVLARVDAAAVTTRMYDPRSIMHYTIDQYLLLDPFFMSGPYPLTGCSEEDKRAAAEWYGPPPQTAKKHTVFLPSIWA